jgi:uncharacterized protein YacL
MAKGDRKIAQKLLRLLICIIGAALGPTLVYGVDSMLQHFSQLSLAQLFLPGAVLAMYIASAIIFAIISFFISPAIIKGISAITRKTEEKLDEMPVADIFFGVLGLIIGLVVALLISSLVDKIGITWLSVGISVVVYVICAYLGWTVAIKRRGEFSVPGWYRRSTRDKQFKSGLGIARPKILDTSVIIDGRIFDICKIGIIEGVIVVPEFVLQELRHIADSSDALKRNRGRRGLDILTEMQKDDSLLIRIEDKDFDNIDEVDVKLLKLAQEMGGIVVTNDYNLNKVADVQSVQVLNINELANAIKPVVLPGEGMTVRIIKDGKETGQGVAYLDDGTMVVVDGGKNFVGRELPVLITSVLQTSAGKMIFAKLRDADNSQAL